MLYPTIEELTQGKFNRYELALATAKCARLITNEYVRQHDLAEKSITGNKETDKPLNTMIDRELRDEKAVHVAVNRLRDGAFVIDPEAGDIVDILPEDTRVRYSRMDEESVKAAFSEKDEDEEAEAAEATEAAEETEAEASDAE
jgi:DNA-directed RNA polymerase subunit K/omega